MLFNSMASVDQGQNVRNMKRLADYILVLFNSLFLIHVILCIIITVDCYANNQTSYVVLSTIIFVSSFSFIFYILFRLNGFVIFYLWSLFVGISICFIPFLIISTLFPIISVLFALIKCSRITHLSTFITNFWSHSTNHIILYELVFTVPHTILYHVMLFDQRNTTIILSCIIIGIAHWIITTAYSIHFDESQGGALLKLTHLLLWNTVVLQIFAIYFEIIALYLISIESWICWFALFICGVPLSIAYFTYKYRMELIENSSPVINWAIVDPILCASEQHLTKQQIAQNLYCLNHAQFHHNKSNQNCHLECNEMDHLLFVRKEYSVYNVHQMGDDECIRYQFEYLERADEHCVRHKSVYVRMKQYFKIRHGQYYKLMIACAWILATVLIYFCYPLIVLINAAVYPSQAHQSYICALFVVYAVFMLFYALLLHTMYTIQHYCGYVTMDASPPSVLSDVVAFEKMVRRNSVIYIHLSECDAYHKAIIARDIIQFLG